MKYTQALSNLFFWVRTSNVSTIEKNGPDTNFAFICQWPWPGPNDLRSNSWDTLRSQAILCEVRSFNVYSFKIYGPDNII